MSDSATQQPETTDSSSLSKDAADPLLEQSSSIQENTTMKDNTNKSNMNFKFLLLVLMVVQNSSTVLVGRHTRSSVPPEELYVVNHLILVSEVSKFILACGLEYVATNGHFYASLKQNVLDRPLDTLKSLVPALLYLVQNSLLYTALSNLSAPLFQVTYQGKLVTTALVSVLMLQRQYSPQQWTCLVVLSVGVAIVVLGEQQQQQQEQQEHDEQDEKETTTTQQHSQSLSLGLTAVTIACMSSALAGVYFEKVLKKKESNNAAPVSLWMRNMQLACFSIIIALIQGHFFMTTKKETKPYFYGFTKWVWVLVLLQAGGGMLVAAVIKYADNVLKGLATGVSVVAATVFSMALFRETGNLTLQFFTGAGMILTAVYFFSNPLPCHHTNKKEKSEEYGTKHDNVEMRNLVLPK